MRRISNYTVEDQPIGSGGMGKVLRGVDPFGRTVAIKEILPEFVSNLEYRARIDREIEFLRQINDPNVVKIYDAFENQGNLYIVMEYVDGVNLEEYVQKNGRMNLTEAARMMVSLLGTMQNIHELGIVHRDIKPNNVMLRRPNNQVCLLDFGIAKNLNAEDMTIVGTVLGTDGYMSPEQAQGYGIDRRTDIYSLGCVLFYLLTGQHAYVNYGSDYETASAIINKPFPRLAEYRNDLPPYLQDVLDRATDKNMMRRYQSSREFANDLSKFTGMGTRVEGPSSPKSVRISIGRENCDICTAVENNRVSRHHADVDLKIDDNGSFHYVITDCSTNGTIVNGRLLNRGMKCEIQPNEMPIVMLASTPPAQLDWNQVRSMLAQRKREIDQASGIQQPVPTPSNPGQFAPSQMPVPPVNPVPPSGPIPHTTGAGGVFPPGGQQPYGPNQPQQPFVQPPYDDGDSATMSFGKAISTVFQKYAYFRGRAKRAEFWWFALFNTIVQTVFYVLMLVALGQGYSGETMLMIVSILCLFYSLAVFLPSLAVTVRRLHDTGRGGVNILLGLIPLVGGFILLYFMIAPSQPGHNQYG